MTMTYMPLSDLSINGNNNGQYANLVYQIVKTVSQGKI